MNSVDSRRKFIRAGLAAHLQIALDNMAATLAAKVEAGVFGETRALEIGRRILHQNPLEFFVPEKVGTSG